MSNSVNSYDDIGFSGYSSRMLIFTTTLAGLTILSILSIGQKYILDADPFAAKGFLIPGLFGSLSGAMIGIFYARLNRANIKLHTRVHELEGLYAKITSLEALLPICSRCKKIRVQGGDPNTQEDWEVLEKYISAHTASKFTHGICPDCREELYPEEAD